MARYARRFPLASRVATPRRNALQYALPDGDVSDGTWTTDTGGSNLAAAIDDLVPDDSDYIKSAVMTVGTDTCEVSLSDVGDSGKFGHGVRYRYSKAASGGQVLDLRVRLLQGVTQIASWTHTDIGPNWTQVSQQLTTPQTDDITDYTDLRLEFRCTYTLEVVNTRQCFVSWAQLALPVGPTKTVPIGRATETDTAQPVTIARAYLIGQATETDTAQEVTRGSTQTTVQVGQASETDTAQPITARKIAAITQVSESETAQSVASRKIATLTQVAEGDSATALTSRKLRLVGAAADGDIAQPVTVGKIKTVTQATETDSALTLTVRKTVTIGWASEADGVAQPITARKIAAVGLASETDEALAVTASSGAVVVTPPIGWLPARRRPAPVEVQPSTQTFSASSGVRVLISTRSSIAVSGSSLVAVTVTGSSWGQPLVTSSTLRLSIFGASRSVIAKADGTAHLAVRVSGGGIDPDEDQLLTYASLLLSR